MKPYRLCSRIVILALTIALAATTSFAQTSVKPGFNLFSTQQDVELGRQSAGQIERQLPMIHEPMSTRYVSRIGERLAQFAPGARYPYQFRIVNLSDLNAFALPGGPVYVHRGLIEKVRTEGELAGVMAHEIAHIALRHQTNQVSKAYLARAGVGILGGIFGGSSRSRDQIIQAVGGIGLNTLFLKYSRSAEEQADVAGAQMMAKAGYDPMEMANFFDLLRLESGRDPGKVAQFFSDHPSPKNRATRIRREAGLIGTVRPSQPLGNIRLAQSELRSLSPAPTMAQVASRRGTGTTTADVGPSSASVPSSRYRLYRQPRGLFQVEYPSNWQPRASTYGATFVPAGGVALSSSGQQELHSGVIVNHYVPFDGAMGTRYQDPRGSLFGSTSLEQATSDLVRQISGANPYLRVVRGSERRGTVSGQRSLTVALQGSPPGAGEDEVALVTARELPDGHVIYVLALAREGDYGAMRPAFERIVRTLRVNEEALHD